MNIQMVDLKRQYLNIKSEIDSAIQEVIDSTQFILGKKVAEFEKNASEYLGVKHAVGVANGTDALQIAMMALGIGKDDEVITTPFTFVATTETIVMLGAKPVYVDIDPETYNINPKKIKEKITDKTKAILPVHLYGNPAEMDEILSIAKEYNLFVIEDSAQGFGAEYKGKKVCSFGDVACISFFPSKNLGCYGDGGMVVTNNDEIHEKVRMIANHGSKVRYLHERLGMNSRLDALQAAILNVKLKYIDEWNNQRIQNANLYSERLKGLKQVVTPTFADYSKHIFHQYTIKVENRDELQKFLASKNIPTAIHYPIPLHLQPAFKGFADEGSLPLAEEAAKNVISLPMHPDLKVEEIDYITNSIKEFYSK
jgi:dTDP-4-amino-4,6-dideoxygalactose transaminase